MNDNTSDADRSLEAGTIVDGRYRLVQRLGRGGFAWVYEGVHIDLGRQAAIKVLSPPPDAQAAEEFTARFLREAQIVARLNHPNVVSIYDFGVIGQSGEPYIAMERLRGQDLEAELTSNGPMEPERVKRLFIGALDALASAHRAGIVHKDLKPSNLFIADVDTAVERLVLLDFGIAWLGDAQSRLTKAGAFTGTPAYAAPEYARHQEVSPAVDVYQMGLIIAESLTGLPCATGDSAIEVIMAHCEGLVKIPDSLNSSPFAPALHKATELDPAARYPNGDAFRDAITAVNLNPSREFAHGFGTAPTADLNSLLNDATQPTDVVIPSSLGLLDGPTNPLPQLGPKVTVDPVPSLDATTIPRFAPTQGTTQRFVGKKQPVLLVGAVIVLAIAIGSMLAWGVLVPTPKPAPAPTPPAVATIPEQPAIEEEPVAPEEKVKPIEEKKRFVIRSVPVGAEVFLADQKLGRTPINLWEEQVTGEEVTLRFELENHKPQEVVVKLEDGASAGVEFSSPTPRPDTRRQRTSDAKTQMMQKIMDGSFDPKKMDVEGMLDKQKR